MSEGSEDRRMKFDQAIIPFCEAAAKLLQEEQVLRAMVDGKDLDAPVKRFEMANVLLDVASNYLAINGTSQSMRNQKSKESLEEARKAVNRSVFLIEEIVSSFVDVPFSDYEARLAGIESVSADRRFSLVQKMGLAIYLLENSFEENTKWKWTFDEMEGRFSVITKNLINLHTFVSNSDFRSPNYHSVFLHLRMAKKLLLKAANRYRKRYEVATNYTDDFKKAISFLSALQRLTVLTNAAQEAATIKKQLDAWTHKLNADIVRRKMQSTGKS